MEEIKKEKHFFIKTSLFKLSFYDTLSRKKVRFLEI